MINTMYKGKKHPLAYLNDIALWVLLFVMVGTALLLLFIYGNIA